MILRGKTFNVGDRIVMGGVRGDVIALDFTQTTIMEMGQPPPVQGADPAMWVRSREYTGRVVTVTNAKIFDEPVFNYTRDFPFVWEELALPIAYASDRDRAERILLETAERQTVQISELSQDVLQEMQRRYVMKRSRHETEGVLPADRQMARINVHRQGPRHPRAEGRHEPRHPPGARRGRHRDRLGDVRDCRIAAAAYPGQKTIG